MVKLDGIGRLVDSHAWDEGTKTWAAPYGLRPMGQICFAHGRMLAALCNGDPQVATIGMRIHSSCGGRYTFGGSTLETLVDVASDLSRVGSRQVRDVVMMEGQMLLRPPPRLYDNSVQRRELLCEQVWHPEQAAPSSNE